MEVFKVVNSLAVALGARRTEMGTVKALHAVLLQLVRPGISNAEACNATGASTSNFSKRSVLPMSASTLLRVVFAKKGNSPT